MHCAGRFAVTIPRPLAELKAPRLMGVDEYSPQVESMLVNRFAVKLAKTYHRESAERSAAGQVDWPLVHWQPPLTLWSRGEVECVEVYGLQALVALMRKVKQEYLHTSGHTAW